METVATRRARTGAWLVLSVLLGAAALAFAEPAGAQSASEAQADFNTARSDALLGTSVSGSTLPTFGSLTGYGAVATANGPALKGGPAPTYSFNALGPADYYRRAGGAKPLQEAAQTTPELKLGFKYTGQGSPLQFSGFLDAASDRYSKDATDLDKLSGNLRVDYVGTDNPKIRGNPVPYLAYAPSEGLNPFFKHETKTTQDFTVGMTTFVDRDAHWRPIPTDVSAIPTWELGLAMSLQRRIVSVGSDSTALVVGPSIKWTASSAAYFPYIHPENLGALSASFALNITRRAYDKTPTASERVWGLQPIFTVAWQLPSKWFGMNAAKYGAPELDFQAAYNDSNSSLSANNSRQWTVGPTLKAGWTFP